jgi:hypothetical protein
MAIERDLLVGVGEALHKTEVAPSGRRDIVDGNYPSKAKNMKSVLFHLSTSLCCLLPLCHTTICSKESTRLLTPEGFLAWLSFLELW